MLADLSHAVGGYLFNIFYVKFDPWIAFGFLGQFFFTMRFGVQWWASEKAGKSVIPFSFWILSIGAGFMLLVYAIVRADPVYIVGQGAGLLIYFRNIWFVIKERAAERAKAAETGHPT
ncbi:lipid-A-disaccharide synthase N-terminal domain-containing protein [Labrys neptuniae]